MLNNYVTQLNKKYIKRYSKITFRDVLYELSIKTINNTGYDNATYMINSKNNTTISSSTFNEKNNFITSNDVIMLTPKGISKSAIFIQPMAGVKMANFESLG